MSENTILWDSVCQTDPSQTKHINVRGGFTAIDAYSQIKKATGVWGSVGEGWGWTLDPPVIHNGIFVVLIHFWYKGDNGFDVLGCSKMDADAPKKALTDGLTKALSYLGFNADVFLGKFDDNKYVAEMKKKFSEPKEMGVLTDAQKGEFIEVTAKKYKWDKAKAISEIQECALDVLEKKTITTEAELLSVKKQLAAIHGEGNE